MIFPLWKLDGQLLNMTEIMQPSLYVLYIFAGSTSHAGLSAARLPGSFCRAQHTELKEKSLCGETARKAKYAIPHTYREHQ